MRWLPRSLIGALLLSCGLMLVAQDLSPRAYLITPIRSNVIIVSYGFNSGNLLLAGLPITDASANVSIPIVAYYRSLGFFGRSANFTVSLPYGVGDFRGSVMGSETSVYRSGLLDSVYRFSVNLKGGPAMSVSEYLKWKQKLVIGASIRVVAPTGQYDSRRLINLGGNRWGFRPEVGVSRRWGHWVLDAYGGIWFHTTNPKFFSENEFNPGITAQSQSPIGSVESHLSYDITRRLWASFDANFWFGGKVALNGVENVNSGFRNSRIGGTVSVPLSKHQSVKFSYSNGAYVRYGGNFQNVSVAWQYSWITNPK
jgi:hypothetical protein